MVGPAIAGPQKMAKLNIKAKPKNANLFMFPSFLLIVSGWHLSTQSHRTAYADGESNKRTPCVIPNVA